MNEQTPYRLALQVAKQLTRDYPQITALASMCVDSSAVVSVVGVMPSAVLATIATFTSNYNVRVMSQGGVEFIIITYKD